MVSNNSNDVEKGVKQVRAPYVPFKTFLRLIKSFKETTVPQRIDASVLGKFSWSDRNALLPALKFLQLTDKDDNRTALFVDLVRAYETPEWKTKLNEIVLQRYDEITKGLNIEDGATRGQLEERFKGAGPGVVEKCIRFYLSAAKEAEVALSKHLITRQPRSERKIQRKRQSKGNEPNGDEAPDIGQLPNPEDLGFKEFDLPVRGKDPVKIWIPDNLTQDDWVNVKKMMEPITVMIETYFGFSSEGETE